MNDEENISSGISLQQSLSVASSEKFNLGTTCSSTARPDICDWKQGEVMEMHCRNHNVVETRRGGLSTPYPGITPKLK